jgi:hypothetical protein
VWIELAREKFQATQAGLSPTDALDISRATYGSRLLASASTGSRQTWMTVQGYVSSNPGVANAINMLSGKTQENSCAATITTTTTAAADTAAADTSTTTTTGSGHTNSQ